MVDSIPGLSVGSRRYFQAQQKTVFDAKKLQEKAQQTGDRSYLKGEFAIQGDKLKIDNFPPGARLTITVSSPRNSNRIYSKGTTPSTLTFVNRSNQAVTARFYFDQKGIYVAKQVKSRESDVSHGSDRKQKHEQKHYLLTTTKAEGKHQEYEFKAGDRQFDGIVRSTEEDLAAKKNKTTTPTNTPRTGTQNLQETEVPKLPETQSTDTESQLPEASPVLPQDNTKKTASVVLPQSLVGNEKSQAIPIEDTPFELALSTTAKLTPSKAKVQEDKDQTPSQLLTLQQLLARASAEEDQTSVDSKVLELLQELIEKNLEQKAIQKIADELSSQVVLTGTEVNRLGNQLVKILTAQDQFDDGQKDEVIVERQPLVFSSPRERISSEEEKVSEDELLEREEARQEAISHRRLLSDLAKQGIYPNT